MSSFILLLTFLASALAGSPGRGALQDTATPPVEGTSLSGKPLYRPTFAPDRLIALEQDLEEARGAHEAAPESEEAIIWLGRRLAYLGRYREAIDVFTQGIEQLPDSYRLLRHRGHRYITLRRFEDAIRDLARAAELSRDAKDALEPDGIPNALNQPLSTDKFNIWYHLALAHYLAGDMESALSAWTECRKFSTNQDLLVATLDWTYMTLRRLGRHDDARALLDPIDQETRVIENDAYLKRILMYKGLIPPDELLMAHNPDDGNDPTLALATQGYGVGNWYLAEGNETRAREIFEQVVATTSWAPFGHIAAEADLHRIFK